MNTKPKTIAFIIPRITNIGGIARVVSLITNSLIENYGYKVLIIGYQNGVKDGYDWNNKIIFKSIYNKTVPLKKGIFNATFVLRKYIKENDIEIVISCGSMLGPLGVLSTIFSKVKNVYWDHSNFFQNSGHAYKVQSKIFTSKFSDLIVTLTKADLKTYEQQTNAKKIIQIYNPIDPKLFCFVKEYNFLSKKIISVGRLTDQKNFEELVDVACIVFSKEPNFEWHIYGEGPNKENIERKIIENNLQDNIILKGKSNDLYSLYNEYSMMVMTSRYEGFPMSLIEGLSNKLPLISYDIATGPNEIIQDFKSGYLVKEGDIQNMAKKILYLLNNKNEKIAFSNSSTELISQFRLESITRKWMVEIEQLSIK